MMFLNVTGHKNTLTNQQETFTANPPERNTFASRKQPFFDALDERKKGNGIIMRDSGHSRPFD